MAGASSTDAATRACGVAHQSVDGVAEGERLAVMEAVREPDSEAEGVTEGVTVAVAVPEGDAPSVSELVGVAVPLRVTLGVMAVPEGVAVALAELELVALGVSDGPAPTDSVALPLGEALGDGLAEGGGRCSLQLSV